MKLTYKDLPQLQVFISDECLQKAVLHSELASNGYRGVKLWIKINNQKMLSFTWPLVCGVSCTDVDQQKLDSVVIPIDVGVSQNLIHEAVVRCEHGHLLINLKPDV